MIATVEKHSIWLNIGISKNKFNLDYPTINDFLTTDTLNNK